MRTLLLLLALCHTAIAADVTTYGAKGDGQFLTGTKITKGAAQLCVTGSPFVAGDVGKYAAVAGHVSKIKSVDSVSCVTLFEAAPATLIAGNGHFCTDDTAAFNATSVAVRAEHGGLLHVDAPGLFCVTSIDASDHFNLTLTARISGLGAGGAPGAAVLPLSQDFCIVDFLNTGNSIITNIQLGSIGTDFAAPCAVLMAQKKDFGSGDRNFIDRLQSSGKFSVANLYIYGVGDSQIARSQLWNFDGSKFVLLISSLNSYGLKSAYQTIETKDIPPPSWSSIGNEYHDWTGGATAGAAWWFNNVDFNSQFDRIDSSTQSTGAGAIYVAGLGAYRLSFFNLDVTSELGPSFYPKYVFNFGGTIANMVSCGRYTSHFKTAERIGGSITSYRGCDPTP